LSFSITQANGLSPQEQSGLKRGID